MRVSRVKGQNEVNVSCTMYGGAIIATCCSLILIMPQIASLRV
jgi:predicted outer membrane repeat protein